MPYLIQNAGPLLRQKSESKFGTIAWWVELPSGRISKAEKWRRDSSSEVKQVSFKNKYHSKMNQEGMPGDNTAEQRG